MSDAPERIWAWHYDCQEPVWTPYYIDGSVEYVRIDLIEALQAELTDVRLKSLSDLGQAQDAWEAQRKAEAERDMLIPMAEEWVKHLEACYEEWGDEVYYDAWQDALRAMKKEATQ